MNFYNRFEKTTSDVFCQIWCSGRITKDDRSELKSAFLKDRLGEEDKAAVDRMLHAIRRGWLVLD
ncbi:hypothetical protein IQ235_09725 [Oscillatoriales cyanobacterium LEGE 11467]|uniref:Uncharacterized protein n=1 Tax=Zarconia navalis LEGE 11467 TaxID=1828826 RepID=A0A928VYC9_9CYAN|nr:hypothetical protein [Zarconia navalis]MBE9041057.1 hypothetical protein [Zarconia navalis LEGE 11467]